MASEDNRESAAILGLSSPTVLSQRPASSPSLHAGCSAIIICREPAAVNSAQIGNLGTPQIKRGAPPNIPAVVLNKYSELNALLKVPLGSNMPPILRLEHVSYALLLRTF